MSVEATGRYSRSFQYPSYDEGVGYVVVMRVYRISERCYLSSEYLVYRYSEIVPSGKYQFAVGVPLSVCCFAYEAEIEVGDEGCALFPFLVMLLAVGRSVVVGGVTKSSLISG